MTLAKRAIETKKRGDRRAAVWARKAQQATNAAAKAAAEMAMVLQANTKDIRSGRPEPDWLTRTASPPLPQTKAKPNRLSLTLPPSPSASPSFPATLPPSSRVLPGDLSPLPLLPWRGTRLQMTEVEEVGNRMEAQLRLHAGPAAAESGDLPLPALFDRASHLHSLASSSSLDQEGILKGVDLLRRCDEMVSKLGLFSSNETKEDVSTANLKYLLVPYYLGEMTEHVEQEDRIPVLKASQDHLKEFISTCEALELVPENELELSRQGRPETAANRREQKVARFRRQKAAETKLQEIKERKERRGRSLRAAALSAPIEAGEEDDFEDDGEEEREAWLATISLALCKAFDLVDMLKKEEEMLLAVKERKEKDGSAFAREMLDERTQKAEAWHHNAASRAPYSEPANPITCATFAQDVIEGRASVSQAHDHKTSTDDIWTCKSCWRGLTSERKEWRHKFFSLVTGCRQ
ncbi:hypothetical protein ACQ4PT_026431 [Festuca glaucescens]